MPRRTPRRLDASSFPLPSLCDDLLIRRTRYAIAETIHQAGLEYPLPATARHTHRVTAVAVVVASDTTNYLPRGLVTQAGIHEISLYVSLDGHQQREADILEDTDTFYDRLRATNESATTSQPAVGDFTSDCQPILDAGDDIVSVHISSGISGTYGSAIAARDLLVEQ